MEADQKALGSDQTGIQFLFEINGNNHSTRDRLSRGRSLLGDAGFNPADAHVLIQLLPQGAISIGLDEEVDLGLPGKERFRAFLSDRVHRFSIEQRGCEWGAATINETDLRLIARADQNQVIVLEREDAPDLVIDDEADVSLDAARAERFALKARQTVEVKVNTKPVKLKRAWHTGAAIKAAAIAQGVAIKPDFTLNLEGVNGEDDRVIGDEDRVFIRGGECFDAIDNHEDS